MLIKRKHDNNLVTDSILEKLIRQFRLNDWRLWGGLLCVGALSVLVRAHFFNVPMISDEGGAAYAALFWPDYQELYKDINYDRFQGLFIIYKLIISLLGKSVFHIRLGAALFNVGTVWAVFFLAKELDSVRSAWIASISYAILSGAPGIEGFTANAEIFAILPLTISAICVLKEKWGTAGLLAGLSVMFKPIGVSGLILMLLYMLLVKADLKSFVKGFICFGIFPLLSVLHGVWIGWEHYWATFVEKRMLKFTAFSLSYGDQFSNALFGFVNTASVWASLAFPALFSLFSQSRKKKYFIVMWLMSTLIGMGIGGEWYWHYFMQFMPVVVVVGAIGIGRIKMFALRLRRIVWVTIGGAAIFFLVVQGSFWLKKPGEISLALYGRPAYVAGEAISDFVKANSKAHDKIYVAFSDAELYYLCERLSVVPQQFWWKQIVTDDEAWEKLMVSIDKREPLMIIVAQAPPANRMTGADFYKLLSRGYRQVMTHGRIKIFRRKDS